MTPTLSNQSRRSRRSTRRETRASSPARRSRLPRTRDTQRAEETHAGLGRYIDASGRRREVVARPGFAGSVLVVDRDAETLSDRRLVAHLGADEPRENAALVCSRYLEDTRVRRCCCRPLSGEDLRNAPFAEEKSEAEWHAAQRASTHELGDRHGRSHRLELVQTAMSIPQLRWRRLSPGGQRQSVSLREVIGTLESYEPVCTLTRSALALHCDDPAVSVTVLRAEHERVLASPIVLNRALRDAVLARIGREELSMSEIAIRCGRIKRDSRGNESGETSWLARRLGILPEGGHDAPTPWIHSDVLGLISRTGLAISPREVEL